MRPAGFWKHCDGARRRVLDLEFCAFLPNHKVLFIPRTRLPVLQAARAAGLSFITLLAS